MGFSPDSATLKALKEETSKLKTPWISEIVLQTNQFDTLKLWYECVLGVNWMIENTPDPNVKVENHHGDGGKQVHAKDVRACFARLPTTPPFDITLAIFEITSLTHAPTTDPGLNHMQLKHPDLETLIRRVELLRDAGIHPHRSANHGPITSFYFRDPDESIVELCINNFATREEANAFVQSEAFRRNPSGIDLDRDAFIERYRNGEPVKELLTI